MSLGLSLALPDGGESVAGIITLLLIPICIGDSRRWQWTAPEIKLPLVALSRAFVFVWAIRVQMAYIYVDSAISKFGVSDWVNGTAEYYIVRDPLFGAAGVAGHLMHGITSFPLGSLALTWGALATELVLAALILTPRLGKRTFLLLDISLHGAIILTMGLWSFGLVMIGSAICASCPISGEATQRKLPTTPRQEPRLSVLTASVQATGSLDPGHNRGDAS